jgi:UDP-glucose:(heptosyl)LPS alpha-1,3-glucosyltransferase
VKVAITHTRYTSKGGVERYVWDLTKRLCDAGHEVHFFCHFWDDQVDPRVRIHKIPNRWKQIRFMKVWSFDRWLSQRVRREDFDVVHGFSKSSYQDIYTDGSGCLLDYQEYSIGKAAGGSLQQSLKRRSFHQRQVLAIEERRFTRGNFHKVVVMSDLVGNQIKSRYGLTDDEVVTIYNGIDTERFHPRLREEYREEYRERIVVPKNTFIVLCVANDYLRKGVPTLIKATKRIKDQGGLPNGRPLRVAVIGKERHEREHELAETCKQLGVYDDVKFYGPQDLVERWMAMSDVLALPTHFDAFGNVVLEALASGLPALVSDKAGAAEVVEDGKTGWILSDPEDDAALAERIVEASTDPARLDQMAAAGRTAAEGYRWDNHFDKMLALYAQVAAKKQQQATATT